MNRKEFSVGIYCAGIPIPVFGAWWKESKTHTLLSSGMIVLER
jgi:hypothetical protein